MFSFIVRLKDAGYKIGVLSNMEMAMMDYFNEQGYDMFDVTIFSCAEGARKPEQWIYKIALDRLQVMPRETVFIDDKEENIAAAVGLGIHGILFTSPGQVIKELIALPVNTVLELQSTP
ncbi:MAG: hypothetical protein A2Z08_02230 [Deltaproteobacteria bacterium RBG_16_54_11]|nr:MAG: hypothetical protein A2Z08_02230 [Deltaproteobacteria bacterium RBG_16_54_11]